MNNMDNATMLDNIHKLFDNNSELQETLKNSKLGKVGLDTGEDPFNNLREDQQIIYLQYMLNGLPILITQYNGKYGAFSKPFNNKAKLLRRINLYSDLLTRSIINNDNVRLPLPGANVLAIQVIKNDKANNKGGRKTRKNRRRTTRRNKKTTSNRKRRRTSHRKRK
jgi:hypothetical protein